jgi:hypothetical protein
MIKLTQDWEFNVLDIYNYKKMGQYELFFNFIRENHDKIPGDIVEAGVFRGRSLIALGMLLKELGSDKRVFGFDSFSGFPPIYSPEDDVSQFKVLYDDGRISLDHWESVRRNACWREMLSGIQVNASNISKSGDFSDTSVEAVKKKIEMVGLDNIELVVGDFSRTMCADLIDPSNVMGVLVDCDLYESYWQTLSFFWPKLKSGGMVFLDEYYSLKFPGARIATDEFLQAHSGSLHMAQPIDGDFQRWCVFKTS